MPTRRSYLATLCSGAVLVAGCGAREPERETPTPSDDTETPVSNESTPPPGDDPPADDEETDIDPSDEDYLDIRDYGAVVDGRTDDTSAIRATIQSASQGDTILLPAGTTVVSTEAVDERSAIHLNADEIPSDLTIRGRGKQSTIKFADNQERSSKVFRFSGNDTFGGLSLTQFRIDGNKANQSERGGHGIRVDGGTSATTPADIRFQHLWIDSCNQTGLSLWRGGIVVSQTTIRRCAKHGISIGETGMEGDTVPVVMITRSLLERNGKDGPGVTYGINCSGGNVLVSYCVAQNNAQGTKTTDNSIETIYYRVRLEHNDHHGYIRAGEETSTRSRVTFDDVVSRSNGEPGFRLSRDTDYVIPTQILSRANQGDNIAITNDASLDAETVWSNNANDSYGLVSDSVIGGEIRNYHPYDNGTGPVDKNDRLSIVDMERRDKRDIETVPNARQVGAGKSAFLGERSGNSSVN